MNRLDFIRHVLSLPPREIVRRSILRIRQDFEYRRERHHDLHHSTYDVVPLSGELARVLMPIPIEQIAPYTDMLAALSRLYCDHYFDLLGSGWVQVRYGMTSAGMGRHHYPPNQEIIPDRNGNWLAAGVTAANLSESQRVWALIDESYTPIDWQLDFKSGYRWSAQIYFRQIRYGNMPGVDVKVPWELTRMQHLPHLAWAYALAKADNQHFSDAETLVREFRNQALDFIASNPPRFGVNWTTPMDIGFRATNWLFAYDLFRAYGAEFDAAFEETLFKSIYQHGQHIITHLEYDPQIRANHYLADITSLIVIAVFLPQSPQTDYWLAFGVQELIAETTLQFHPDGANFEASTSYHRMSAEMVAYATALVLSLPSERLQALQEYDASLHHGTPPFFPDSHFERLRNMGYFTRRLMVNKEMPQLGDNDSGRFLKLQPSFVCRARDNMIQYANLSEDVLKNHEDYWDENLSDHTHVVNALDAFFEETPQGIDGAVIKGILGDKWLPLVAFNKPPSLPSISDESVWRSLQNEFTSMSDEQKQCIHFEISFQNDPADRFAYVEFGAYVVRSPRFYLVIRCGSNGQYDNGGHAHNDQLSIELYVDGKKRIVDPGTYVYTPLPTQRNRYRSVQAHFAPCVGELEPGSLGYGLFRLGNEAQGKCLYWGENGFIGVHRGYGGHLTYRMIAVEADGITIFDWTHHPDGLTKLSPQDWMAEKPAFSPKYGWVER